MSIVLRDLQTKKIIFFCKGADSSMLERADPASIERSGDFTKTIDAYAVAGLRTLVYSANEWSEKQWQERSGISKSTCVTRVESMSALST